mmetsp:Transcript_37970/g.100431  ORF Transcript_37970/g.100431 Transcript_37970/m.100431 type:complete len:231 (+) Transcript_37970:110-802(+)
MDPASLSVEALALALAAMALAAKAPSPQARVPAAAAPALSSDFSDIKLKDLAELASANAVAAVGLASALAKVGAGQAGKAGAAAAAGRAGAVAGEGMGIGATVGVGAAIALPLTLVGGLTMTYLCDGWECNFQVKMGDLVCGSARPAAVGQIQYMIFTEEGPGHVYWYAFETKDKALKAFSSWWCSRLLFDVSQPGKIHEIAQGGTAMPRTTIRAGVQKTVMKAVKDLQA